MRLFSSCATLGKLCFVVVALTYLCPQLCYRLLSFYTDSHTRNLQTCFPRANLITYLDRVLNFQGSLQSFSLWCQFPARETVTETEPAGVLTMFVFAIIYY